MRQWGVGRYLRYGVLAALIGIALWLTWRAYWQNNLGFATKTYWDWLELLIIPAVLGLAGIWFGMAQGKVEREIALDRQQQETLDRYLDKMTDLVIEKGLSHDSAPQLKRLARTRTLIALRDLDASRNRQVVQFLRESELLGKEPVIDLSNADLTAADLAGVSLIGEKLTKAKLTHANLRDAILSGADLAYSDLSNVNLRDAYLTGTNLTAADLSGADLTGADLGGANLTATRLGGTKVSASQLSRIGHGNESKRMS